MSTTPLTTYILEAMTRHLSDDTIRKNALDAGWSIQQVDEAMEKANSEFSQIHSRPLVVPPPPSTNLANLEIRLDASQFTVSRVLLVLGVIIMLIAGTSYIFTNWSQWGPLSRIVAIFVPMGISSLSSLLLWKKPTQQIASRAFALVGGLLFPFFLTIVFRELQLISLQSTDLFVLSVSLVTFVVYFCLSVMIKMPEWSPLTQIVGLSIIYTFLRWIGFSKEIDQRFLAWVGVMVGTGYFCLALMYEKVSEHQRARYTRYLSVFVLAGCLLYLTLVTPTILTLLWLLGIGSVFVLCGVRLERNNWGQFASNLYFLGIVLITATLSQFPASLVSAERPKLYNPGLEMVRMRGTLWRLVGVGGVYIGLSYILQTGVESGLHKLTRYVSMLRFFGPLLLLSSLHSLGLGGSHLIEELLLLGASLGFIFGSIPEKVQQYLVIGTFFLIIWIFSIGGEYFQDQVGWPVTLFVTGLASMGISVVVERVRRSFFVQKS